MYVWVHARQGQEVPKLPLQQGFKSNYSCIWGKKSTVINAPKGKVFIRTAVAYVSAHTQINP